MIYRMFLTSLVCCAIISVAAAAEPDTDRGRWILETSFTNGVYSGRTDRDNDYYFIGRLEYETPLTPGFAIGVDILPLFIFHDDNLNDTIYGVGAGLTGRWYWNKEYRTGPFNEIAGAILWHSREFEDNDSSANFLCGIGVGYAFPDTQWHVTLKADHISNGGIRGRNQSINGIGIAIGYLF